MPEIILHHYDMSPYAEKIRLVTGLKGLPWRSVHRQAISLIKLRFGHLAVFFDFLFQLGEAAQ